MARSRRVWLALVTAMVPLWLAAGIASARSISGLEGGRRTTGDTNRTDHKPLKYYILQVMGAAGQVTFEVCGDTESKDRLKSYEEEYATAQKEWYKAKSDARKNKQEFTQEKPKGPMLIKKLDASFKKEEDARTYAEKMQKKWDEALEKKKAAKEAAKEEAKKDEPKKEEVKKEGQ